MDGRFAWRRAAIFFRVAASVAALLAMEGAALSQQPGSLSLVVELPGAGPDGRDLESALRRIIGDEPLRVVDRKKGVIETNARSYDLLSADASVTTVRPLDERSLAAAPARQSTKQAKSLVEWTIRLRTVPTGGAPATFLEPSQARSASTGAQVEGSRRFDGREQTPPPMGSGRLLVRGLDAAGHEVVRVVIDDPRIVRAETADSTGRLVRNQQIIRTDAVFNVALPYDARVASIDISASDDGRQLRSLATIPAH